MSLIAGGARFISRSRACAREIGGDVQEGADSRIKLFDPSQMRLGQFQRRYFTVAHQRQRLGDGQACEVGHKLFTFSKAFQLGDEVYHTSFRQLAQNSGRSTG